MTHSIVQLYGALDECLEIIHYGQSDCDNAEAGVARLDKGLNISRSRRGTYVHVRRDSRFVVARAEKLCKQSTYHSSYCGVWISTQQSRSTK